MIRIKILSLLFLLLAVNVQAKKVKKIELNDTLKVKATLIASDKFNKGLDNWVVEQMPGGKVGQINNKLEIEDAKGCTVWFKHKQKGPIMIEYDAHVIKADGPLDRASDLNCFWMARDNDSPADFFKNSEKRGGKFSNYDNLRLYYVGVGGHFNTKTRFRRYVGNGERPLLPGHDLTEAKYLITPNKTAKIRIIACDGIVQYYRDGELLFNLQDNDPYTSGYFGFRTVHNHMTVDNFKIYKIIIVK